MFGRLFGGLASGGGGASFEEVEAASKTGNAHLIDVRGPAEFAAGHIAGSVNMPLSAFDPSAVPQDKPVIFLCQSGVRSGRALSACKAEGARSFAPGVAGWRSRGGVLVR